MINVEKAGTATGRGEPSGRRAEPRRRVVCAMPMAAEAVPVLRRFARDTARCWLLPESVREALTVVVTELVTNVLLHSGSPYVVVTFAMNGALVTAEVKDGGTWRTRRNRRRAALDENARCGRGLHLVEAYSATCTIFASEQGTRVVAELLAADFPGARSETGR